jgi:hypothetical protein
VYREFVSPEEILSEAILAPAGGKSIEITLDIPKKVKAFDIAFEVEVSYKGKTELVKFQSRFVRSKYLYLPPD